MDDRKDPIEIGLAEWKSSLLRTLDAGGLYARNPTAHKWKAPFRVLAVREIVGWRTYELVSQSYILWKHDGILGALTLLRSAIETIAVLAYLNRKMRAVTNGQLDLCEFDKVSMRLFFGSKNNSTDIEAINVLTILSGSGAEYDSIRKTYDWLSEVVHPNHEGMAFGYAMAGSDKYSISFSDRWPTFFYNRYESIFEIVNVIFRFEYNLVFKDEMEKLEAWLVQNNS